MVLLFGHVENRCANYFPPSLVKETYECGEVEKTIYREIENPEPILAL
jgi:hypothetical protein